MEVTIARGTGKMQHVIRIGKHQLLTDVAEAIGGEDTGPEPHDLLAASLAACTALTVTLYAKRKGMALEDIRVSVSHHDKDGAYEMNRHIEYIGALSAEERERLTGIANKCPVHKTLTGTIRINTEAV
ncbi:OsmC family protein [Massilia niastensis]|uniref:OsmC family protein n=1 Tax=Massilia niastensis TaxID=544911 RepID=UPI00036FCA02|nr:OsmC family protein [Massilia niastensis]